MDSLDLQVLTQARQWHAEGHAVRLVTATRELEHFSEYDYLVVNDNLETALKELSSIYIAARCARVRRGHYGSALLEEARTRAKSQ